MLRIGSLRRHVMYTTAKSFLEFPSPVVRPSVRCALSKNYAVHTPSVQNFRTMSTSSEPNSQRSRLTAELKSAMKAKDTFSATVLRNVLSEIYAADKTPAGMISSSQITSILRKAIDRQVDAASKYRQASREDLADAEMREANFLSQFVPPAMSEHDIDIILKQILIEQTRALPDADQKRSSGLLLKAFYSQVDKSLVDGHMVKDRAMHLLSNFKRK